ncbi:Fbox domain WD G-beta repeat-containing [Brachionus plicatilis]|uniref:Fbox domain WD G-beta repeat-containing n=1 Tax=Brachionus plicatilis TaxID=10195 RepID=A0A3M7PUR4_BRAPC|nr:Fbox domain WD G-beta repeat-containing [Brachionus plicatilis]
MLKIFFPAGLSFLGSRNFEETLCVNTLNGHSLHVSCLQLIDQYTLASGSSDYTIKIWDLRNYNCVNTLNGHSFSVSCLQLIDQYTLASGSSDNTIKIWDLRNYNCVKTLNGHSFSVSCLQISYQ